MRKTDNWRPKYYLALVLWSRNDMARARDLLTSCGNAPDFAPFYAARAKAFEPVSRDQALADLRRAAELDPREWRFGKLLTERFIEDKAFGPALDTATRYFKASPDNYMLGMLHAKSLLLNRRYAEASDALAKLNVLPYEGATEGRALYREAQLMLARRRCPGGEVGRGGQARGRRARVARAPGRRQAVRGERGRAAGGPAAGGLPGPAGPGARVPGHPRPPRPVHARQAGNSGVPRVGRVAALNDYNVVVVNRPDP